MNWTRRKPRPSAWANERAVSVLPTPGTSSSRTWPRARMPASTSRSGWRLPTTAWPTRSRTSVDEAGALGDRSDVDGHRVAHSCSMAVTARRDARRGGTATVGGLGRRSVHVSSPSRWRAPVGFGDEIDAVVASEAVGGEVLEQRAQAALVDGRILDAAPQQRLQRVRPGVSTPGVDRLGRERRRPHRLDRWSPRVAAAPRW